MAFTCWMCGCEVAWDLAVNRVHTIGAVCIGCMARARSSWRWYEGMAA